MPLAAHAEGSLYVDPETGVYTIGELFDIKVLADTGGQKINAAEAELTFNPEALEVQQVLTNDSILESWPTPPTYSNQKGSIRFSGWTKGVYQGDAGLLVTIRFKALHNMSSNAYLAAGAMLAADGKGSNIITSMKSGLYSVEPTHVDALPPIESISSGTSTPADVLPSIAQPAPDPSTQTITFEKQSITLNQGERIVVNGTGPPNAKIVFFLSHGDEQEKFTAVTSDSDGAFTFASDQGAKDGVYRLRVAVQDMDGTISPSQRVIITVRPQGLSAAVGATTDLISSLIPLLALLVLGGLGGGYLYHLHVIERLKHKRINR